MKWTREQTYNIYTLIPRDTNLCALSTEVYADDTHDRWCFCWQGLRTADRGGGQLEPLGIAAG
jgi:hypothetical protein